MGKIILILVNFILGILLLSQSFSGIQFWKGISEDGLKEYYNSMSDKDIAFSMGYVTYRNYMEQLKVLKINTNGLITKVDYSELKSRLKGNNVGKKKSNNDNQKKVNNIINKKKFRLPIRRLKDGK